MNTPDYSQDQAPVATDKLQLLTQLAQQQAEAEQAVLKAEQLLKAAAERLADLSERMIPTLMDEIGMSEFVTSAGFKVKVQEIVRASIPKARAEEAVKWLDDHGHRNLVKRKFTVTFGKDDEAWAKKFARDLAQRKRELNVEEEQGVHAKTLSSFVKEQLEAGQDIPLELFGVFRQRVSKLEVRK